MNEIDFCIEERIAVLGESDRSVVLALNRVSFGSNPAKLDLRRWKDGKPCKGVQLTDDEARDLLKALQSVFADSERTVSDGRGRKKDDSSC